MANEIITTVITSVIASLITGLSVYIKSLKKRYEERNRLLENGMLSLLRAEIIRQNDKWTEKGYCPIYAKDALEKAYNSYHQLGGNGTITKLYNETMALDEEPKNN